MPFKELSGGNGWIKPADHVDDVAILVEVKRIDLQRATPNGPKDSVLCDFSYFADEDDLEAGKPEVVKGQRVEQTVLARQLIDDVGEGNELIVVLTQSVPKKAGAKPAWVFRLPSKTVQAKVIEYYEGREKAVAAAMADAPDFGDDDD